MANKRISELSSRTPSATDLMLIGDPTTGYSYKCTLLETIGLGVPATRTITINGTTFDLSANRTWNVGTVTSVGLSMPSAFIVSGSPVTNNGTLTVTAAGTASQYIRGDGQLATLPTGGGGGGASVSYYLNGSVSQGTFGGTTYYEVNKTPVLGTGTNFTTSSNGYIASFITDAGDPGSLLIPGGNWNFEVFFAASSGGGTPTYYVELYKYDGTTFSLIASSSSNPDVISGGTAVEAYFSTLAVPETALAITDRLAIRIYVTTAGRTITLHTEDNNLCQIVTTFSTGITALNGLTKQVQYFATGTSGTDFGIVSSNDTHTFNLPSSSATNRGLLTAADWTTFNGKQNALNGTGFVRMTGTTVSYVTGTSSQFVKADGTLDSSVYVTSNIYTADGTLTGNRTVTMGGNTLTLSSTNGATLNVIGAQSNSGTSSINIYGANNATRQAFISATATGAFSNNILNIGMSWFDGSATIFTDNYIQLNARRTIINFAQLIDNALIYPTSNNTNTSLSFSNGSVSTRGAAIFAIASGSNSSISRLDFAITNAATPNVSTSDTAFSIFSSKNIGINTTTDAGFRLDVNGTARVQSTLTATSFISFATNQNSGITASSNSVGIEFYGGRDPNDAFRIGYLNAMNIQNSTKNLWTFGGPFLAYTYPLGTNVARIINFSHTINTTGGTNTITAIYYNPTLTSTTGTTHNFLHNVTGNVLLCTSSGYVGIGATADTAYKLSVDGDLRVYGNIRTAQPTGGTGVGVWRLGSTATGTFTLDTALCVEIEIGGTLYRLATVDPA